MYQNFTVKQVIFLICILLSKVIKITFLRYMIFAKKILMKPFDESKLKFRNPVPFVLFFKIQNK